ncbi:hypothetical protein K2173_010535 [Erythroxylum novogranatense]|uniref:Uncharacterized protein n=1 Tax=Erythroxylum novogranatense TaxID=1862640 RepID=A0AAV8TEC1_9ROSI|nr:hypothetical protein K2173_010535 [Erythroxylum novogranatense]
MAGSSSNRKFYDHHSRSNSLPSSSHPLITQLDDHLCRLKASQATSASVSSQSIGRKLNDLQDLYECVDKFLQLPLTQQVLAHAHKEKWVDELLDGSLSVLEACTTAKDSLLHTKESARELQSILRRRAGCFEICRNSELQKYLVSRKVVKKAIKKALKDIQNKCSSSTSHGEDETRVIMSFLKEVEAVTLEVFESLLYFISGPKAKATGWSLVSKLVYQKRVACTKEEINHGNEFSKVDSALLGLILDSTGNSDKLTHIIKNLQSQLDDLDSTFQDLENGLHCLFRQLIKSRVALLNILNP